MGESKRAPGGQAAGAALPARIAAALAVLSGLLYFAAFPGVGVWPCAFVSLVPLIIATRNERPARALAWGLVSGTTTAFIGFWWLLDMLTRYSGFPLPLCVLFLLLLSVWQGGRMAAATWLHARASRNRWPAHVAFVACTVASEALFPLLFPWYLGAALQPATLLTQIADLGGPMLLSALAALVNVAVLQLGTDIIRRRRPALLLPGIAFAALAASGAYGAVRIRQIDRQVAAAPSVALGLVQGNIPMDIQGRAAYNEAFQGQVRASYALVQSGARLIIWSESAFLFPVPEADAQRFVGDAFSRDLGAASIVGAVLVREQPRAMFNSALLFKQDGQLLGRYDKHHLLAFGEYIPLGETFPWLYDLSPASGHFTPGKAFEPMVLDGHRMALLICYEDILPGFVNAAARATSPELLVNITNDAWFGETAEPLLHLALSQLRAIEHRKYLVRAANTGVSAVIDPAGRLVARTAMHKQAALRSEARWLQGRTGYALWGDAPWYLVALVTAIMAFWRRPGSQQPQRIPGRD
jgi:apolipoprotein N-acyltransferase